MNSKCFPVQLVSMRACSPKTQQSLKIHVTQVIKHEYNHWRHWRAIRLKQLDHYYTTRLSVSKPWPSMQVIRALRMRSPNITSGDDRWAVEQVSRWAGGQVGRWAGGQVGRCASRQVDRWAGGQVGRWAGGQVGRTTVV